MIEAKPTGEAAPLETERIQCAAPGPTHFFERIRRGGARPKFCPEHRRRKSVERSEIAYGQRKRMAEDIKDKGEAARKAGRVHRIALGLRSHEDPVLAAMFVGVTERGPELDELVRIARRDHASIISGDARGIARLAETAIGVGLVDFVERQQEMAARDVVLGMGLAVRVRDEFKGDGPTHNYVSFSLSITPCPVDGKLTEEQRARVRGLPSNASPESQGDG